MASNITDSEKDMYWDFLIDYDICSEEALRLVTNINGYSVETLDDVLYCQTGYRSIDQYCDAEEIDNPFENNMPEWEVTGIEWDIDATDLASELETMDPEKAAKILEISLEDFNEMKVEEDGILDYCYALDDPEKIAKIMDLPTEYTIPEGETEEDGINDWLSDELGWTIYTSDYEAVEESSKGMRGRSLAENSVARYTNKILEGQDFNKVFSGKGMKTGRVRRLNESTVDELLTVGLYGDEVPGCDTVQEIVKYFRGRGLKVSDVSGNMDHGWEMNVTGMPRDLFFAVCDKIPGYNSNSVQDFIDEYRIDERKSRKGRFLRETSTILRDKEITSCDDVDELYLYIANDGDLYRSRTTPIINNLKKKVKKGTYDPEFAVKAFMYLVDDGVRKYDKEFVSGQGNLFLDKKTREEIARQLRDRYEEEINED